MTIGTRRNRDRRRRTGRALLRAGQWLGVLAIFGGLGYWSYQSGLDLARTEVTDLEERLDRLGADARGLRATNARLEDELRLARQEIGNLQRRYERDVPAGDAASLYRLAQQRIASGLSVDRVQQVMRDAGPVRRCEGRGQSRRFQIINGPIPDEAGIVLLDGLVRVAVGVAAPNEDPARAASVVVTVAGQERQTFTGLPQRQVVTLGNVELALSVTSELRGFATVAITNCNG